MEPPSGMGGTSPGNKRANIFTSPPASWPHPEGSDDTLRDAIKVLGQGIEKLAPGTPIYRMLPPNSGSRNGMLLPQVNGESEPLDAEYTDAEEEELSEASEVAPQETAERPKKRRIQKVLVPIKGIDWNSEPSFRDYAKQKNPGSAQERYLVVAGWFRNHRETDVVTPSHIVAAFDVMDWEKPEDIPQLFRVMKHSKRWFDKGPKPHEWILGQRGMNQLDRLGEGDSAGTEE